MVARTCSPPPPALREGAKGDGAMNTDQDREQARDVLLRERAQTVEEIEHAREALEYEADYVYGEGDPGIIEREKGLAMMQSLTAKLAKIDKALERLDKGTYGVCVHCGKPINPERLEILPYTDMCITCQAERERLAM